MRAPNSRRAGCLSTSTTRIAAEAARFSRSTRASTSLMVVQPGDQRLQVGDVPGGQRAVLGEMGDQRGDLATEQPIDQPLALGLDIALAGDQRAIEIAFR